MLKKKSYFEWIFFGDGFIFLIDPYHTLSSKTIKAETQQEKTFNERLDYEFMEECCLLAFSLLDSQPIFFLH